MTSAKPLSVRTEIRQFVDAAKAARLPIDSQIIWGSLARDVPEHAFKSILSLMTRAGELTAKAGAPARSPDGRGRPPCYYEPGRALKPDRGTHESWPRLIGNMEHARLVEARKAARGFWKEGVAA